MKYIYKDYLFGNTLIRYIISKESGKVFLNLLPKDAAKEPDEKYESFCRKFTPMDDGHASERVLKRIIERR